MAAMWEDGAVLDRRPAVRLEGAALDHPAAGDMSESEDMKMHVVGIARSRASACQWKR
jgi:hypothetical protein